MTSDPEGPQRLICIACLPLRHPVTGHLIKDEAGRVIRCCDLCRARRDDVLCECSYCPWLVEENKG